jgi:hypothetical protein
MTRYYCTYFDHRYANRGVALYRSLERTNPDFRLWVLCLTPECEAILSRLNLPRLTPVSMSAFEAGDDALARAKTTRSAIEYYFTCSPSLPLYVFRENADVDLVTYVDADLHFHESPEPLFEELGDGSIAIIAHRFPPGKEHLAKAGIFNVGWVSFRRDQQGLACLSWWRERCLEWCYDRFEDGKFADQAYLDSWPSMFPGVRILEHKGANLAPWNIARYRVHWDGSRVLVDGQPLLFFHFHGLKKERGPVYNLNLTNYEVAAWGVVRSRIYRPYLRLLHGIDGEFRRSSPASPPDKHASARGLSEEAPAPPMLPPHKRLYWALRSRAGKLRPGNYAAVVGPLAL